MTLTICPPPPRVDEDAVQREAWTRVAAGFDEALAVAGLPDVVRARLLRCRDRAWRLAGAGEGRGLREVT